jgi:hypothetical protein
MRTHTLVAGLVALVIVSVSAVSCAKESEGREKASALTPATADSTAASPAGTAAPAATPAGSAAAADVDPAPAYREVTVPAGTLLSVELRSTVASDSSRVEDQVRGTVRRSIVIHGLTAIPAGSSMLGHVTDATRSARVKGRAHVAFRFNQLDLPGAGERMSIRTGVVARQAAATKKQDAAKIGGGAVGGAIVGGILGGGDGAAKGAAIGGAAGTGVVLATRGKEIRLPAGTPVSVKLLEPVTVRVRVPSEKVKS